MRFRHHVVFAVFLAASASSLDAQQYVTDDAGLTEFRACQIQMWQGQRSSWVLPVCTPLKHAELSLGFIAVWEDGADGHFEYVAQVKTVAKALATDSWGIGFVFGTGRDPAFAGTNAQTYTLYSYVPISESFAGDRLILDENLGGLYLRADHKAHYAATWAVRADARLAGRIGRGLVAVAEAYGSESVGTAGAQTQSEYQVGLRTWVRPDHVQIDGSYGRTFRRPLAGRGGPGWTIGLTLITPPFL